MTRPFPLLIIYFTLSTFAVSAFGGKGFEPSEYNCKGIDAEIKKINNEMRRGYTNREGERYREKLRELKSQRHACKKRGFAVD